MQNIKLKVVDPHSR